MIAALTMAVLTAQPCLKPGIPHAAHRKRAEPAQSCAAPVVPMCYRESPEPALEPLAGVYAYYIEVPTAAPATSAPAPGFDLPDSLSTGLPIGGRDTGGVSTVRTPACRVPEIEGKGSGAALVLLLGAIAAATGRRR